MKLTVHIPHDENENNVSYYIEFMRESGYEIEDIYWRSFVPPNKFEFIFKDDMDKDMIEEIKAEFRELMKDTNFPYACLFAIEE
jgi:hypothetical protein